MNLLDYIIIIILILSTLAGFKKGLISTVIAFAGTLLVIILAFYLKNPISVLLYNNLPFLSISGKFEGMNIINILIYEGASYIITLLLLSTILGIVIKLSGIFSKIVHATIILTIPSKILGAICGFIEGLLLSFLIVFIISLVSPLSSIYNNSKYADTIIDKTPVLSTIANNTHNSVVEIYNIAIKNKDNKDKTEANKDGLRVLLKYEILSVESAEKLVDIGKLKIDGASEIINKYKEELSK